MVKDAGCSDFAKRANVNLKTLIWLETEGVSHNNWQTVQDFVINKGLINIQVQSSKRLLIKHESLHNAGDVNLVTPNTLKQWQQ
jgi:hypothetical protein